MPDDATTTDTAPETGTDTEKPAPTAEELTAQVEHWRAMAKKQEERAKANVNAASELEKLRQQSMTDTEKAVAEAKTAGRVEAQVAFMERIVAAEIRAALAGIVDDPGGVVDDLNLAKYLTADGEVDTSAVAKLRERYQGLVGEHRNTPDLGQGNRGGVAARTPRDQFAALIQRQLSP